jgi:hypothetical protein
LRLKCLTIEHPQAAALKIALALNDPRVKIVQGPHKALSARFETPQGERTLR